MKGRQTLWALRVCLLTVTAFAASFSTGVAAQPPEEADTDSAAADDSERARQHYELATSAFEAGNWQEAATLYERSYELSGHAELLYNIGLAHERIPDDERALASYRRFIAETSEDAPKHGEAMSRVRTLEARLAQSPQDPPPVATVQEGPSRVGSRVVMTLGGAALATSAALLVVRLNTRGTLQDSCEGGACAPSEHGLVDRYNRLGAASWATLGVGVACIGVGLLLRVRESKSFQLRVGAGELSLYGEF